MLTDENSSVQFVQEKNGISLRQVEPLRVTDSFNPSQIIKS